MQIYVQIENLASFCPQSFRPSWDQPEKILCSNQIYLHNADIETQHQLCYDQKLVFATAQTKSNPNTVSV